jgi:hypothetical protein
MILASMAALTGCGHRAAPRPGTAGTADVGIGAAQEVRQPLQPG